MPGIAESSAAATSARCRSNATPSRQGTLFAITRRSRRPYSRIRVRGVRSSIPPALSAHVDEAVRQQSRWTESTDPLGSFVAEETRLRDVVQHALAPGTSVNIGDWLKLVIVSVSATMDARMSRHYEQLVDADQTSPLELICYRGDKAPNDLGGVLGVQTS
jgi:hypothetical protein